MGSHAEVADRIAEYHALGVDHFILSGHPHLEEAYWFGEGVLLLLRDRGLLVDAPAVVDVAELGPRLLATDHVDVLRAVDLLRSASLLVVATPTYKGSYTDWAWCWWVPG